MLAHRRPTDRAARAMVRSLTAVAATVAVLAPPAGAAAKTTVKTVKKAATGVVMAGSSGTAAPTGAVSDVPISGTKSAGTPLVGWERIAEWDRPVAGDAVVADAVSSSLIVRRAPGVDQGMLRFDAGRTVAGSLSLLALGGHDGYVRVLLPVRPNGTVGWVRAQDVRLRPTTLRVVVELSTNTMTVEDRGLVLAKAKIATGTGGTPTPVGQFFVKELVAQANPRGALGPYALGLSAYSEVLMSFAGGSGVVAIHGTNAPGRLGSNVSHGCIRVDNTTISRLARGLTPVGTPVEIVRRRADLPMVRQTSDWTNRIMLPAGVPSDPAPAPAPIATAAPTTAVPTTTATTSSSTSTTTIR